MNRIIFCIAIAFVAIAPASSAWADDPAPSKEQLEAAKKAFGEGKALYEEGKYAEAVEKFKESYRLSRNPLLLYNIGFSLDQAGQRDKALFYYRKFLSDAPQNAAQRKDVTKRVEVIEKEKLEADLNGTSTPTETNASATTAPKTEEPKAEIKIKPAGTYSDKDFQHQLVDAAPPGKPLDITAFVPEDSGFTVTLYYRGSGDAKFVAKPMKWRYKELVARIPASKMAGSTVQYYLEVKDQAGTSIAKSGKSTSPNLVYLDESATPRFYPDLTDEEEPAMTASQQRRHDDEDPLGGGTHQEVDPEDQQKQEEVGPSEPATPGNGFRDVGSSKFEKAKWISTGAAGVFVGASIVTYILAKKQASNLEADSTSCGTPPCRQFDGDYDLAVQDAGKRYNTLHQVTTVFGVAAVGVAAYFWYRQLTAKQHGELKVGNKNSSPETTWAVTPSLSEGFTGAAAAVRF